MICSQTGTHVQTHTDPINASDSLYWALSKGKKKIGKSIVATLQKLLLSGHMSPLQSQRDSGGGFHLNERHFTSTLS